MRRIGIADANLHQETIELRFRQRIRSFELHRILRGENGEGIGEEMAGPVDGHLQFFHGFEQRGLRARRHAVDLVHEQQIGEDRTAVQAKAAGGRLEDIAAENVGGNQIGRALHALELQTENVRERFHRQRLRQTRHALDERVAAREHHD